MSAVSEKLIPMAGGQPDGGGSWLEDHGLQLSWPTLLEQHAKHLRKIKGNDINMHIKNALTATTAVAICRTYWLDTTPVPPEVEALKQARSTALITKLAGRVMRDLTEIKKTPTADKMSEVRPRIQREIGLFTCAETTVRWQDALPECLATRLQSVLAMDTSVDL